MYEAKVKAQVFDGPQIRTVFNDNILIGKIFKKSVMLLKGLRTIKNLDV